MTDPTAIDIRFDPTVQRMTGRAIHGDTPFDVPFISHIVGNLWQGGCQSGLKLPADIVHVVSLYPWEAYRIHDNVRSFLSVRMYDDEDQQFDEVDDIARWVVTRVADGPTLVHCQAGLNRSSLIVARSLMLGSAMSAADAIALIRSKRSRACLCNTSFEAWLTGGAS